MALGGKNLRGRRVASPSDIVAARGARTSAV